MNTLLGLSACLIATQLGITSLYHFATHRKKKRIFDVKFIKEHPAAKLPTQKQGDAAFDLYSVEGGKLEPGETLQVDTGLRLAYMTPSDEHGSGLYFQMLGRSGKALSGVYPIGGVLDNEYRGTVKIIMHNGSNTSWSFEAGDRVAQMTLAKIEHNNSQTQINFNWANKPEETSRGASGFGASGK